MCDCSDPVRQCHSGDDCRYVIRAQAIHARETKQLLEDNAMVEAALKRLERIECKLDAIMDFVGMPCD